MDDTKMDRRGAMDDKKKASLNPTVFYVCLACNTVAITLNFAKVLSDTSLNHISHATLCACLTWYALTTFKDRRFVAFTVFIVALVIQLLMYITIYW